MPRRAERKKARDRGPFKLGRSRSAAVVLGVLALGLRGGVLGAGAGAVIGNQMDKKDGRH